MVRALTAALECIGLLLCVCLCACSAPHLAGTNDAVLEYAIDADPATGTTLDARIAAAGVKARLSSAQLPADVDAINASRVRIVVDADVAGAVDELVTWRGGLSAYLVDDAYWFVPEDTSKLQPMHDGTGRWWQGPSAAVGQAVRDAKLDGAHAVLSEKLSSGDFRTRVVSTPPLAELGVGSSVIENIQPVDRGRALSFFFAPDARAPIEQEQARHPNVHVALVRSRSLLSILPIDQALATPLVVPFGQDITSYTRAYRTKQLLRSPILPPLHRLSAGRLPQQWGLAVACALLPFALSFGWLFFVRRFDRARPEPMWLVVATFALGGLAILPAALVELACATATPWLDTSVVTLGGQPWALPLSIVVFTTVVGGAEEGSKFLGAWSLARHRREFDEPVDGIVYGCAAALGFAAVENVKYFAMGRMSGVVIAARAFMTVPAHMFFGAIWGYAMGRKLVSRKTSVLGLFMLAALAHGTFDAVLSTDGMQLLATLLVLVLAFAFIAMLRSALRHGAVPVRATSPVDAPPSTEPVPPSTLARKYFRVGSPGAFYASAAGMIVCAFALTVLGGAYEVLHHRAGLVFVAIATTMLVLFGLAAYGASSTIPLDVAIDARGITFAGALTPWSAITGFNVEAKGARAVVKVATANGVALLGPAKEATAREILEAIRAGQG